MNVHQIMKKTNKEWLRATKLFPQAPEVTSGSFQIFLKIHGDIRKSRCTAAQVSMTPEANFTISTAGVIDTSGKFAAGINLQPRHP